MCSILKEIFAWVDWFEELAFKVATNDPDYLITNAKKIPWRWDEGTKSPKFEHPLLDFGDENIDPFSLFYLIASKAKALDATRLNSRYVWDWHFAGNCIAFAIRSMSKSQITLSRT